MPRWTSALLALACAFALVAGGGGRASAGGAVRVAVASNFAGPARRLANDFTAATASRVEIAVGSTGGLYAQIENGAPFDVLLAADEATPAKLEADGHAVAGSRFVYAYGKLVLWSAQPGYVDAAGAVLARRSFRHLAVANPKLAPYGAAALQALSALELLEAVRPTLVWGESVAQAYQFAASGNAEVAFVALSQVAAPGVPQGGSWWVVPARLYSPIRQGAALLRPGAASRAARAFYEYLKGPHAREVVRAYGYGSEP